MTTLHKSLRIVTGFLLLGAVPLHAANQNWDGGSTANGNWTTAQNWSGDAVPGNPGGSYTLDGATFNASVTNGWGESVDNAIRIDTARSIDFVDFSGASGNYFLGLPGDSVLTLFGNGGGGIRMGQSALTSTSVVATVQAPLEVGAIRSATQFSNTATSGSGVGSGTLVIDGTFNQQTTSPFTLRLLGTNTNNNIVLSDLADNGAGTLSISKTNAGKWVLAGDNSFTGTVSIGQGELSVGSLNSVSGGSATSNLGAPVTVANGTIAIASGTIAGALRYTGSGETSDRVINLAGTTGAATLYQAGTGTLTLTSNLTATGAGSKTLFLGSSTTAEGRLEGAIVNNSATNKTAVLTYGPGTWTMAGSNTYTGTTRLGGGTMKLDYGTNNTSKLSDTGVLSLSGGTLELSGGSHAEVVASGTLINISNSNGGVMTTIRRTSGSATISLGAITSSGNRGVLNIEGNIATTTTANNAAGILAANTANDGAFAVTMNGTDFATKDGSGNIVAYTGYTAFAGAMANNTVYLLTGNGSLSTSVDTRGTWIKIDTDGAGQSLNAGGYRQQFGAVLFTGAHDYEITSTGAVGSYFPILNYGTGTLTVTKLGGYSLYHYGTGTTVLQDQAVSGMALNIVGGTVVVSDVLQLGALTTTNTLNLLDGGTLRANTSGGDVTMANNGYVRNFTIGENTGRFDVVGGGNLTISGTVTSTRGLTIIGSNASSGTVVFSGSNTYAGGTRLDGGTWRLDSLNASGTGEILFNGGTLAYGSGISNDHSGRFANSAGQTFKIDTNGNDVSYLVGLNSVGGSLTKLGAGTLTLGGASTYNGTTTVSAGTLALLGSNRLADASALVVNGGEFALGTASETVSSVTLSSGTISSATGVLQSSGGFTLQSGTVSGILGGSGAVTKSGAGTVVLSGANTYSGGTTISGGTLQIGGGSTTGSVSGTITAQSGGVLEFNRSDATTVSNTLAGAGTFRQIGGNTLTLDGANTTNGTISATNGTILFSGANALPSNGSLSASSNATLSVADGTTRNSTLAGGLTMSSANFVFDINSTASDLVAFAGAASLSGTNVVKLNLSNATSGSWTLMTAASGLDGGTWFLDTDSFNASGLTWTLSSTTSALTLTAGAATNNYYWTGDTSALWGTASNWSSDSAGSSPRATTPGSGDDLFFTATTASNLSTTLGADFTVNSISITDPGVSIASGNTLTANATSAQAFLVSADSGTTTLASNLAGANAGLTKSGNGSLTLSGSNTYGGATTITAGTLTISGGAAIADTGAVVLSNAAGAVFSISASETIGSLQGGGAAGGNATIASGQTLTVAETGTNTFSGVIGGAGNLVKSGAGTMVLDGANTYSGSTTISAGTLQIGVGGATGSIDSTSGITNNGTLAFNRSDTMTFSLGVSGSGGISQLGSGTLVLAGNSNYTGATTISAGTLQIGSGGTTGSIASTSGISNNATLAFNRSDTLTVSAPISGTGGISQLGSGTLVLSGSNSYTGTTTLSAGTILLDHANAMGTSGTVAFTGGTLRYSANNTADISSRVALSSSAIQIDTDGQSVTFASGMAASNLGGLVKNGTGTLILAGANGYTGSTTINAGTLQIGNGGATGSLTSYGITNNGTLVFDTSSTVDINGANITGSGDLIYNGSGTLSLGFTGQYNGTGNVIINSGTLSQPRNNQIGDSATLEINGGGQYRMDSTRVETVLNVVLNNGTIDASGVGNTLTATGGFVVDTATITSRVALAGGSLTKNGSGSFTLVGNNTYSGGTTLNSGTLVIANASGAGNGTITQTDGSSLLKFDTTGTVANALSIHNVASNQTLTLSGNITAQNTTYDVASGTTLSINGTISGNGGVTKIGDGTLELNAANTFTGATVVNTGTLKANATGALATTSNITVTGGSLLVTADNAIGDSVGINLAGGTLAFSGNVTDSIGALTLSANSVIDLGEGDVVAIFANLFMGNYTLAVHNWTGTTLWNGGTGNNTDQIYFNRALDGGELDRISFYSDFGSDFLGTGFQLGFGSGFQYQVIPVPEAETWMAAALLLAGAGVAWMRGRRRKSGNMDGQDQQDGVGGVGLGADAIR